MKAYAFITTSSMSKGLAVAVALAKFGDDLEIIDTTELDETGIDDAIDAIVDASADAIIVLATAVAETPDTGEFTDAQITALADKLKADLLEPYDEVIHDDDSESKKACANIYELLFPGKVYPQVIRYFSGTSWPVLSIATANIADTTVTKAGAFAGANYIGKILAIPGYLAVAPIASHTDNALTLTPGSGVTDVSENCMIVDNEEEAFAKEAVEAAAIAEQLRTLDRSKLYQWVRLIDLGVVEPQIVNSMERSKSVAPVQDLAMLKSLIILGNKILRYNLETA